MNITDIKVRKLSDEDKMKAIVSVTFDDEMVIHDIKVIQSPEKLFVAMPSRKMPDGRFVDIAHPINAYVRQTLEESIIEAYQRAVEERAQTAAPESEK